MAVVESNPKSTLRGCWHNQLGTKLVITADDKGRVSGEIHSEVGGRWGEQPVLGYLAPWPAPRGVIGLVVRWGEAHSITTWTGHFDLEEHVIAANWLLTTADFDANEWQSTRVGYDLFRRDVDDGSGDVAVRSSA